MSLILKNDNIFFDKYLGPIGRNGDREGMEYRGIRKDNGMRILFLPDKLKILNNINKFENEKKYESIKNILKIYSNYVLSPYLYMSTQKLTTDPITLKLFEQHENRTLFNNSMPDSDSDSDSDSESYSEKSKLGLYTKLGLYIKLEEYVDNNNAGEVFKFLKSHKNNELSYPSTDNKDILGMYVWHKKQRRI